MRAKEQAAESQRNKFTLGVDIGGTKIAAGLVDAQGSILFQTRVPMCAREDAATGFAAVQNAIEAVFAARPDARARLAGIGICAPGPLDPRSGVVLNPPNVPCWRRQSGARAWDSATCSTPRWAPGSAPELFSTNGFITGVPEAQRKAAT